MRAREAIFFHDVATVAYILPFAFMCLMETLFDYTIYPLFLTHALAFHMFYDLVWIFVQPQVITAFRNLIALHHLAALTLLIHPMLRPWDAPLTAIAGIIEFDTSLLILRRLFNGNKTINRMYLISNVVLRIFYETLLTILFWYYFKYENFWVRLHIMSGQVFINLFSYAICTLTYTKEVRKHLKRMTL